MIQPGKTVTFGFEGSPGDIKSNPTNMKLISSVTDDSDVQDPEDSEIDYEKDTDSDGLKDYIEIAVGSDINKIDTDGDGISDYDEMFLSCTDPTEKDTDQNGVSDGEEDSDGDSFTTLKEINELHTDPMNLDTDGDGLSDYDEVMQHKTKPNKGDTDEDGLGDYDELLFGLEPLKKDTDGNGILDGDEKFDQVFEKKVGSSRKGIEKVTLKMKATGNIQNSVWVRDYYGIDVCSSVLPGLIGVPVGIQALTEFDEAELIFTYNELPKETKEEDLGILWYNEEGLYELQKSSLNKSKKEIKTITNHFSKFMVVDTAKWKNIWKKEIDYGTASLKVDAVDICFLIDISASMQEKSFKKIKESLREFINQLNENDRISILVYGGTQTDFIGGFEQDRKAILEKVENIGRKRSALFNNDGTSEKGLKEAVSYLAENKGINGANIFLLSDDDMKINETVLNKAKKNDIKLFVCNVENQNNFNNFKKMIADVGGYYYMADTSQNITSSMLHFYSMRKDGVDWKDTDKDGMPDVFEQKGIRVDYGKVIKSDENKSDTDGDGVSDFDEINGSRIFIYDYFEQPRFSLHMESDPSLKDTDGDGYEDGYFETNEMVIENNKVVEKDTVIRLSSDTQRKNRTNIQGFEELLRLAYLFLEPKGNVSMHERDMLVLQIMRCFSYSEYAEGETFDKGGIASKIQWPFTAGAINIDFYEFIFYSNNSQLSGRKLLSYYTQNWSFLDESGNYIDGSHFAATLNTYYYRKGNKLIKPHPITNPYDNRSLPNMAGWAGDLHTFMAYRIREDKNDLNSKVLMYLPDCKTYETAKNATKRFMGHQNSRMSMPDILADIDAANLAFLNYIRRQTLDKSILSYYKWGEELTSETETYVYRYDNFIRSIPLLSYIKPYKKETEKEDFKNMIKLYVNKIQGKEWPIYDESRVKAHELDGTQRAGIIDGFYDFILARCKLN